MSNISITTNEYVVRLDGEVIGYISVYGNLKYVGDETLQRWVMDRGQTTKFCESLGDFYQAIEKAATHKRQ